MLYKVETTVEKYSERMTLEIKGTFGEKRLK